MSGRYPNPDAVRAWLKELRSEDSWWQRLADAEDFPRPSPQHALERGEARWLEVMSRARDVARRTGFRGELRVLAVRALDVYEELYCIEDETASVRRSEERRARAGRSRRPQPAAPESARRGRGDKATRCQHVKAGGGSTGGTVDAGDRKAPVGESRRVTGRPA